MTWMGKLRLRLLVLIIGVPLAAFAAISVGPSWLALPVVGFAFYAAILGVSKTTSRLVHPVCWTCGGDLSGEPGGDHGVACRHCGALNQRGADEGELGDDSVIDEDEPRTVASGSSEQGAPPVA